MQTGGMYRGGRLAVFGFSRFLLVADAGRCAAVGVCWPRLDLTGMMVADSKQTDPESAGSEEQALNCLFFALFSWIWLNNNTNTLYPEIWKVSIVEYFNI